MLMSQGFSSIWITRLGYKVEYSAVRRLCVFEWM